MCIKVRSVNANAKPKQIRSLSGSAISFIIRAMEIWSGFRVPIKQKFHSKRLIIQLMRRFVLIHLAATDELIRTGFPRPEKKPLANC